MRKFLGLTLLVCLLALGGCATPLGQQYGTVGAIGGAIIGGAATGDIGGAIIGGAAGAIGGGLIGDQQTYEYDRHYQRDYPRYQYQPPRYYQRPCQNVRVPVYNRWGEYIGYRIDCR
jgi:uncharacterized protein YcfJ